MDSAINSVIQAQQGDLATQVQFAVARKSLDTAELVGEGLVQMIEVAAQIGKAVGAGANFDAMG